MITGLVRRIAPEPRDNSPFERAKTFSCNPGIVVDSNAINWEDSMINPQPPANPLMGVSLFTHYNDATVEGKGTMDLNGAKQPMDLSLNTTVNSNCTFSATGTTGKRCVGVFLDGGIEYFVLALPSTTTPNSHGLGIIMSGLARRVHPSAK